MPLNNKGASGKLNCPKFLFSLNHLVVSEKNHGDGSDDHFEIID